MYLYPESAKEMSGTSLKIRKNRCFVNDFCVCCVKDLAYGEMRPAGSDIIIVRMPFR